MQRTEVFRQLPLSDPFNHIRVLQVDRSENGTIACSLIHIPLTERPYTCLSYCWGSDETTYGIEVNGKPYSVRGNLYNFLHMVADRKFEQYLWIDAISINQDDKDEKALMVRIMGDIYANAAQTILWLGVSDRHLDALYDLRSEFANVTRAGTGQPVGPIRDLDDSHIWSTEIRSMRGRLEGLVPSLRVRSDEELRRDRGWAPSYRSFTHTYAYWIPRIRRLYQALREIASCEYWSRAWITSEIIPSKRTIIPVSKGFLNFADIAEILPIAPRLEILIARQLHVGHFNERLLWRLLKMKDYRVTYSTLESDDDRMDFDAALDLNRGTGCSIELDRVYSILSLINPIFASKIVVDYNMSPLELYHETVAGAVYYYEGGSDEETDESGNTIFLQPEDLYLSSSALRANLALVPPKDEFIPDQSEVLQYFSQMTPGRASNITKWADPEPTVGDTPQETQERADCGLIGLYTAVYIDSSAFVVLELLFEEAPTRNDHPDLHVVTHPRAWLVQGGQIQCYKGVLHRYSWPPLNGAQGHGTSYSSGDGDDNDSQGGDDDDQGGDDDEHGVGDVDQERREGFQRTAMQERESSRAQHYGDQGGSGGHQVGHSAYPGQHDSLQDGNGYHREEHNAHQGGDDIYYPGGPNKYQEQQYGPQSEDPEHQGGHYGYQGGEYDYQGGNYGNQGEYYDYQGEQYSNQGEQYGYHQGNYNDHDGGYYTTHPGGYYNGHGQLITG